MRNWNEEAAQDMKEAIELLVYLWGIETGGKASPLEFYQPSY